MTSDWDTPEIIELRALQASLPETSSIRTRARIRFRRDCVERLLTNGGYGGSEFPLEVVAQEPPRVDTILGLPASGKSSFLVNPLRRLHGALLVDADEAKLLIPEYEGGRMAATVHQESSDIADELAVAAIEKGLNAVIPLVGKNSDRVVDIAEGLVEADYRLYVHLVEVPLEEACARAVRRFAITGRFVDPFYIQSIGEESPALTYDRIKDEVPIHGYSRWSNNVPEGERASLVEASGQDALPEASG